MGAAGGSKDNQVPPKVPMGWVSGADGAGRLGLKFSGGADLRLFPWLAFARWS